MNGVVVRTEMLRVVQREVEWGTDEGNREAVRTERMDGVVAGTYLRGDCGSDGSTIHHYHHHYHHHHHHHHHTAAMCRKGCLI